MAIRSEIKAAPPAPAEDEYPKLMRHVELDELVILMTAEGYGIILHEDMGSGLRVGEWSRGWRHSELVPFDGVLELTGV